MTYNFNNDDDDNIWNTGFDPYEVLVQLAKNQSEMSELLKKQVIRVENLGKSCQINHNEIHTSRQEIKIVNQNQFVTKEYLDNLLKYSKTLEDDLKLTHNSLNALQEEIRKVKLELAKMRNKDIEV